MNRCPRARRAFVVLGVAVLRRTGGVRGNADLTDPQAVIGVAAVFEDPDPRRPAGEEFAFAGADDRYSDHEANVLQTTSPTNRKNRTKKAQKKSRRSSVRSPPAATPCHRSTPSCAQWLWPSSRCSWSAVPWCCVVLSSLPPTL